MVVVAVGLAGLGVWRLVSPPATPPGYGEPRPRLADDGYVGVEHSVRIEAAPEQVWAWTNDPGRSLAELVQFDDGFPAVVATQPLTGDWVPGSREGDRRRVEFADGHFLAEEVLVDDTDRFRYQIWGFTSQQRLVVGHGVAEFRYAVEDGATRMHWTYEFLPTTPLAAPLVQGFLDRTISPMMVASLAAVRDGVEGG